MKRVVIPMVVLALIAYALSGMYSVGPSQRGVQTFMGRPAGMPRTPGLHIHAPWPIGGVRLVDVSMVRSTNVKFEWPGERGHRCYLLTGDENVVELALQVHYVVSDPVVFVYADKRPDVLLGMAARADSVAILSGMGVDDALTIGRPVIAARLKDWMNRTIARHLGVQVTSVLITKLTPPVQVRAAFAAVASAKADQARRINDAYGDRNRRLPRARANALNIQTTAQAKVRELLDRTQGWIDAFNRSLLRYKAAPMVTMTALLTSELPRAIGRVHLILVDPAKVGTLFLGGLPPPYNQVVTGSTGHRK